jgi:3,4-dihydroxy 2-butanone 4-phosphate synthase/GTP cyclohydrolase II
MLTKNMRPTATLTKDDAAASNLFYYLPMSTCQAFLDLFHSTRCGVLIDDAGVMRSAIVAPAQNLSPEEMNRLLTWTGGLPFVAISPERAAAFLLPVMARPRLRAGAPTAAMGMPQLVSVEAREGVTTGISALDRATTVAILGDATPQPRMLVKPGHIFPVETREGGVLVKAGIPEGAIDIATMAGFTDAALYLDLLGEHGELADEQCARQFAERERLPCVTLTEIIRHRLDHEQLISRITEARLPTTVAGEVTVVVYRSKIHDVEHVALVKGDVSHGGPVLVRVQPENTVPDVFGGSSPPSRKQLHTALRAIGERGSGVIIYLRRPFMDDKSGQLQALGQFAPQPAALMREYGVGAQILRDLKVSKIELLTSSTRSLAGLSSFGIEIVSQHPAPEMDGVA